MLFYTENKEKTPDLINLSKLDPSTGTSEIKVLKVLPVTILLHIDA